MAVARGSREREELFVDGPSGPSADLLQLNPRGYTGKPGPGQIDAFPRGMCRFPRTSNLRVQGAVVVAEDQLFLSCPGGSFPGSSRCQPGD